MSQDKKINFIVKAAFIAYCLSLALPVFYTQDVINLEYQTAIESESTWYGIFVFFFGWLAAFGNPARYEYWSVAWFANPLFFIAIALLRRKRPFSLHVSLVGLVIALTSFSMRRIWSDKEPPTTLIAGYGPGFYLWLVAFALVVWAALELRELSQKD